jgi:hypothetical protein
MTKEQLKDTYPLTLREALGAAFDAGHAYAVGSHPDFRQIHEPHDVVVEALESRVNMHRKEVEERERRIDRCRRRRVNMRRNEAEE